MKAMIRMTLVLIAVMSVEVFAAEKVSSVLNLKAEFENGKMYNTGDDKLFVLQLKGNWYEMGKQYGKLGKEYILPMWDGTVKPVLDKKWTTEEEALDLFGKRVFETLSTRRKQYFKGVADGMGWPVEKVVLLDQGGLMGIYQGKLHSFSGCSSMSAWGKATVDGHTYIARNMDWSDHFLPYAIFLTVFNPTDGSNKIAHASWPAWHWLATGLNDKGVYTDLHDGTSMGGAVVSAERPSFLHSVFDFLAECDSTEALSARFVATRTDLPTIWMLADRNGKSCSFENTLYDNRKRLPEGDYFVTVNSFLNPDWGLHLRDTISHSLTRHKNLMARAKEAHGKIDAAKTREIFDLTLFNEDGSFRENGGATKPKNQDVDLTNYQFVADLNTLDVWMNLPA